jgi:integrase/recombinase XerD
MSLLRQRMIEDLKIRNYSPRTIEVYVDRVAKFAQHFGKSPDQLGPEDIRAFQLFLVETKQCSWALLNQTVCALRFFYGVCLEKTWMIEHIPYAKKPKELPVVLSREEVFEFFDLAQSVKHRTILMTLYGTGTRISEALALQVQDVDSRRMLVHIRHGKGARDRYVPLSEVLLEQLRCYWRQVRPPSSWLFPGQSPENPLGKAAIQRLCTKTRRRASLAKKVTPHTFRHSFATHHLEAGTDLKTIQVWMGHKSLRTTSVYLHVAVQATGHGRTPVDLLVPPFEAARSRPGARRRSGTRRANANAAAAPNDRSVVTS